MEKLNDAQLKAAAREFTLKAIESEYLPQGRNGTEAAKIVLDFYHELINKLNED